LNTNGNGYEEGLQYLCFAEVSMTGQLILGFCKSSIKWKISKIATTRIKQGLGGKAGNKGAVVIRFNIDNTSVIVANAHLESGKKHVDDRIFQFKEITNDCVIGKRNRKYDFRSHDIRILFGDLNFRIEMSYDEAKSSAVNFSEADMQLLNKHDQLNMLKKRDPVIGEF
jgi:hypothetical protein